MPSFGSKTPIQVVRMLLGKARPSMMMVVRLLVLITLVVSALPSSAHADNHTLATAMTVGAPLVAHHADGTPCHGHVGQHGITCCPTTACQPAGSCLIAASPSFPTATPIRRPYALLVMPGREGIGHIPTPPPPRTSV
jgi:hypothetical protein